MLPAPVSHVSYWDGFYAITFGNYCGVYRIYRTLNYIEGHNLTG